MQFGFVIDHSRCIGCHACTVACKAENDVPLGSFRTWVKYTEAGTFPEVRRSFAVLRCNQCSDAPCVAICPVKALEKRPDGIVDVDPAACIGCKACMQGCPYDALYLNEESGTAEKCHFCAHRVEMGLAPACAVVCPTEAIIPGDFHDRNSVVSRMRAEHTLTARKVEAGTGPNVFYREVSQAGIDPTATSAAGGYLWANQLPGIQLDAARALALEKDAEARARTTYDVNHKTYWGGKVGAYLFTKSLAAGLFLFEAAIVALHGRDSVALANHLGLVGASLLFLALTTVLLVADLKRPERFLYILLRPNWTSWVARGAFVLTGFAGVATIWMAILVFDLHPGPVLEGAILAVGSILAVLTACYTGWLFFQAKGRVLWMRRGLTAHLVVQAVLAGAAGVRFTKGLGEPALSLANALIGVSLVLHVLFVLTEGRMAPRGREREYELAMRASHAGAAGRTHLLTTLGLGAVLPALLIFATSVPGAGWLGALLILIALLRYEDFSVRAGQALPIS